MDPTLLSAFAVFAGSVIGGMTSLVTSVRTHQSQLRAQHMAQHKIALEDLYGDFIDEAAKLCAHALVHELPEVSDFVGLYAKISKMRFLSSPIVVSSAEDVARKIVETYRSPNKTMTELKDSMDDPSVDLLRRFSETCGAELKDLSFVSGRREHLKGPAWRRGKIKPGLKLLAERPVDSLSVDAIVDTANVTKGSFSVTSRTNGALLARSPGTSAKSEVVAVNRDIHDPMEKLARGVREFVRFAPLDRQKRH